MNTPNTISNLNPKLKIWLRVCVWIVIICGGLLSAIIYNPYILKPLINAGIPLNHLCNLPLLGNVIRTAILPQITVEELQQLMNSKNSQLLLIDVRTPDEYEYSHLPGSILVPLTDIESGIGVKKIKSFASGHKLITYCSVGFRSNKALEILEKQGITGYNLQGGIKEWREKIDPSMPQL